MWEATYTLRYRKWRRFDGQDDARLRPTAMCMVAGPNGATSAHGYIDSGADRTTITLRVAMQAGLTSTDQLEYRTVNLNGRDVAVASFTPGFDLFVMSDTGEVLAKTVVHDIANDDTGNGLLLGRDCLFRQCRVEVDELEHVTRVTPRQQGPRGFHTATGPLFEQPPAPTINGAEKAPQGQGD